MSTNRKAKSTDPTPVEVLRSDSGEHAVIVGTTIDDGLRHDEPADVVQVRTFAGTVVRTIPVPGSPIGLLGLAQTALDDLTAVGNPGDVDPMDLDGAFIAMRLAGYGVSGLPGSRIMHPVVEHVLRYTDADQVRLVGDGTALSISKFGITAVVELPAAVAEFVELYDGPEPFPYPGLYAVRARAS